MYFHSFFVSLIIQNNTHKMKTTPRTTKKARNLSMFLFDKVTLVCELRIEEGEEETKGWMKRIVDKYGVIA